MRTMMIKAITISAVALAIGAAAASSASADDRWHHRGSDGWAFGAAGLATGLVVGSALASEPAYYDGPVYYDDDYAAPPPPRYYVAPRQYIPVVAGGEQPWSPGWVQYCMNRYRTFDDRTGTFVGNDGARHFCVAS